jgi:hypothetical protein
MQWLLDYLGEEPIALECTAESNIAFYKRYDFEIVERVELVDDGISRADGKTIYWLMLRKGRPAVLSV